MDELSRTAAVYEAETDAFVEKFTTESIAERFWDEVASEFPGEHVLDVGCGPGADVETFAERGYDVVGFDLTRSFLVEARERVDAPLVRGDMRSLPFESGAFDVVWACASLLHVPREAVPATLREFRRVLDAPGTLVATLKRAGTDRHATDDRYFERYQRETVNDLAGDAGFDAVDVAESGDRWLELTARVADA